MTAPSLTEARRSYDLARYGDASMDAQNAAFQELRAAEQATESLDERCFRLGLMAADKDAEAERHLAAAADAAGLAAGRRLRGNDDEAARSLDREELYCTKAAAEAMAEAERLRSQAGAIRRSQRYASDYMAIVAGAGR